ncbi:hypothetical protein KQI38_07475 [Tissierella carlieri]|uniref:hypothetical protein n=1 Tax=Tissierella carlieri TaxID=689904 RepID=UPI001C106225|nr:hypothetical protein [Tissierella carlieri]MBU5311866.1 hypothetical protein [Tissierella carlieri]
MRTLSPDELAIELKKYLNTGIESKILKEHRSAMLLQETINIKKNNTFMQYSSLYEQARNLEKADNIDGALNIYLDILNKYIPEGSSYYERPCILLEKLKRYDEAIEICDLAIARIENYNFNFSADDFIKRLDRLIKKKNK